MAGVSDLIIVANKRTIFAEIKTEKGRQSPAQKDFQKEVEKRGHEYLLWRSVKDCHEWIIKQNRRITKNGKLQ